MLGVIADACTERTLQRVTFLPRDAMHPLADLGFLEGVTLRGSGLTGE